MSDSTRLDEMLSLWQQAAERGESASTQDLCRDYPELLAEFQRRVEVLRQMGQFAQHVNADATLVIAEQECKPSLPLLPGYDVLCQLGAGGMGVVYQARDRQLDRTVAVKMLKGGVLSQAHRHQFLVEAKAVASLNHPHIVQLFAFGEHEGHPYLVMELVRGETLQQRSMGEVQPAHVAARLVMLLARAVQAAHECGIIHRDLKPANVLLAPPMGDAALDSALGCPKLTDFGLALRAGDQAQAGKVAGTPSYMAPEQAIGRVDAIGPATDVYALGAILYQLLTTRPPFRAATVTATLHQVTRLDPVPPRLLQPETPRDLETICLKCLRKDPARRYTSAQALADDLNRFLAGEPILARPTGALERAVKWARRKPVVASLLSGLVVATIVTLGALGFGWRHAEQSAALQAGRADYERREREKTEEQLYLNQIALSSRDLADGKPAWALATLRQSPARLRRWEWHHLMHRCQPGYEPTQREHLGKVSSVAASADGHRFASADSEGTILIWDADARPGLVRTAVSTAGLLALPTGAGSMLPSVFPGRAELPIRALRGHFGGVNWLAFSPTGHELYSGGEDGAIVIWDAATGAKRDQFLDHDGPISCLAIHPNARWIASATFRGEQVGKIYIWDRYTRQILHRLHGHTNAVTGLAFHPDGETLVSASHDRTLVVWNAHTGAKIDIWRDHQFPVACVAFSPDGKTLASAAGRLKSHGPEDSEIIVWDHTTGKVRHRLQGHADRAVALAFTPDGERLATAGWDRRILLWNPATGQEVLSLSGHHDGVLSVTFTKRGQLLSGSYDRTVRVWEAPGQ